MTAATGPEARTAMVRDQLEARGIRDPRVLAAMVHVPREAFVPEALRDRAYEDGALPLAHGQTISQPYMVARSCEALSLTGDERVLEVGGGSGYQAAVLGALAREVVTVEWIPELAAAASRTLARVGLDRNVRVVAGDGVAYAATHGPFDRVVVAAGADALPPALLEAVAPGGVLVAPVGPRSAQRLLRLERDADGAWTTTALDPCVFVPLIRPD